MAAVPVPRPDFRRLVPKPANVNTSMDVDSTARSVMRTLHRTIPFDTNQAILFLPEKGSNGGQEDLSSDSDGEPAQKITGNEARQFYEEVLSMPEQQGCKDGRRVRKEKKESHLNHKSSEHLSSNLQLQGYHTSYRFPGKETRSSRNGSDFIVPTSRLFCFAQEGDLVPLKLALAGGKHDVNTVDSFGWTMLMCASHAGHVDVVQYLLQVVGAQWKGIMDRRGNTAVDLARISGHFWTANLIENFDDQQSSIPDTEAVRIARKRRKSNSDEFSKRSTYYCEVCKMNVPMADMRGNESEAVNHRTSTLHQFSCQHKPRVSFYGIPQSNRGYQLLLKGGWDPEGGLGSRKQGQKYPIKTVLKQDRLGLGVSTKETSRPRVTHFSAFDEDAVKSARERSGVLKNEPVQRKKKEIVKAAEKERKWEIKMRRYMNSDYSNYS